jgi:hypothetical protein
MVVAITFVPGETVRRLLPNRSLFASRMVTTPAPFVVEEFVRKARLARNDCRRCGVEEPPPPQDTHPAVAIKTKKIPAFLNGTPMG